MAHVDLYDGTYEEFSARVLADVRLETYGEDIGQNSWITADEFDSFVDSLELGFDSHLLEVACGSGGPALRAARRADCRVTGVDVSETGVAEATRKAELEPALRARFQQVDADQSLPFPDQTFDAIVSTDAMNHLQNRAAILRDWFRILKPGGRIFYTDPVVITGPVTEEEIAIRSSIGRFIFVPPGLNEQLINSAGFRLLQQRDLTDNEVQVSKRWHDARERHREALIALEGDERFAGLQRFFQVVHRLTSEKRISRLGFLAERRD